MPSPLAIFAVLTAEIAYATNPILTVTVTTIHQDFKNGKTFCKKRMQLHPLHPSTYSIKRTVCTVASRALWCVSSIYNVFQAYMRYHLSRKIMCSRGAPAMLLWRRCSGYAAFPGTFSLRLKRSSTKFVAANGRHSLSADVLILPEKAAYPKSPPEVTIRDTEDFCFIFSTDFGDVANSSESRR